MQAHSYARPYLLSSIKCCAIIVMILLYMRNINLNKFQLIIGVLLFSTNTEHAIQSILGQLGLLVAYNSTVNRLYLMSSVATSCIHDIGEKWSRGEASFHIVYNNINQYH